MLTKIYKLLETNHQFLAIMPRPRGGDWLEGEIRHLAQIGVNTLVSLLEQEEIKDLDLESEEILCINFGIHYINYPIKDRETPDNFNKCVKLLHDLYQIFMNGHSICIHCRMGIGRSSLIATPLMMMELGISVEESLVLIQEKRGLKVPDTNKQIDWLFKIQEHL